MLRREASAPGRKLSITEVVDRATTGSVTHTEVVDRATTRSVTHTEVVDRATVGLPHREEYGART